MLDHHTSSMYLVIDSLIRSLILLNLVLDAYDIIMWSQHLHYWRGTLVDNNCMISECSRRELNCHINELWGTFSFARALLWGMLQRTRGRYMFTLALCVDLVLVLSCLLQVHYFLCELLDFEILFLYVMRLFFDF